MNVSPIANVSSYLIATGFNLYITIVLLRLLLQFFRADFYNPISQFIVQATDRLLIPLRKIIPVYGSIDSATFVLALMLKMIQVFLLYILQVNNSPSTIGLFIWSNGEIVSQVVDIFFYATILSFLSSWLAPTNHHPAIALLGQLTEPLFFLIRRVFPPKGHIDFSPLFIIIGLQVTKMIVITPIIYLGQKLAGM